jgi:hypothetical protein
VEPPAAVEPAAEPADGAAFAGAAFAGAAFAATGGAGSGDEPVVAEPAKEAPATEADADVAWCVSSFAVRAFCTGPTKVLALSWCSDPQSSRFARAWSLSWEHAALSSPSGEAAAATPCGSKAAPLTSSATVSGRHPPYPNISAGPPDDHL